MELRARDFPAVCPRSGGSDRAAEVVKGEVQTRKVGSGDAGKVTVVVDIHGWTEL